MKKIIFICTGNTCRSPMAEGYLKAKELCGVEVLSRGIMADGSPVAQNSVTAMLEKGVDISAHISKQLTYAEAEEADRLICMSSSHAEVLEGLGIDKMKCYVLGVNDPYGGNLEVYRTCRNEIISAVDELIEDGII